MSLSNVTAVEGDNVTLHCNATGNPAPNITWNKNGNPVVLYQGETFSIANIRRTAAGDYSWTAWNGVGDKVNATASVTVQCEWHVSKVALSWLMLDRFQPLFALLPCYLRGYLEARFGVQTKWCE